MAKTAHSPRCDVSPPKAGCATRPYPGRTPDENAVSSKWVVTHFEEKKHPQRIFTLSTESSEVIGVIA